MRHSQTFRFTRLFVILLFILSFVAIVIVSGKQLFITKRVEALEKEVEVLVRENVKNTSELSDTDTFDNPNIEKVESKKTDKSDVVSLNTKQRLLIGIPLTIGACLTLVVMFIDYNDSLRHYLKCRYH